MNIEETKEAIRVMQAFVDGKDLEVLGPVGKWEPVHFPRWGWDDTKYRIKPTATLRPWTADEVPLGAWMRTKNSPHSGRRIMICGTYDEGVRSTWLVTSEHSTDCGKTWLPCGVIEESK
jgi:hypothetical protein